MYFDGRYNRTTTVYTKLCLNVQYFYSDSICFISVVELQVAKYFFKNIYLGLTQVCWYRIYGREVEGVRLKVRIGDCHLVGTGETVGFLPVYEKCCKFKTYTLKLLIKCKDKRIKQF